MRDKDELERVAETDFNLAMGQIRAALAVLKNAKATGEPIPKSALSQLQELARYIVDMAMVIVGVSSDVQIGRLALLALDSFRKMDLAGYQLAEKPDYWAAGTLIEYSQFLKIFWQNESLSAYNEKVDEIIRFLETFVSQSPGLPT